MHSHKRHFAGFLQFVPVVCLLWLQFFLRSHNILAQDPYVDEGFHITRAGVVWDFGTHPGRFAHGKILLYFWLGLFEADRQHVLLTSRLGMAIFSLVSAATLYLLGRLLHSSRVGLMALGLYTIFPYSFFFERMTFADPFAAGLALLALWRSLVFVRRPTWTQSAVLGVLLGLTTLAKLTTGLFPAIAFVAALFYFEWKSVPLLPQIRLFTERYFLPLALAALIVILMWLPIVIPAYLVKDSADPFTLVDKVAYEEGKRDFGAYTYLERVLPEIDDFVQGEFLIVVVAALAFWAGSVPKRQQIQSVLLLLSTMLLLASLTLLFANIVSSRYFMPLSAPMVLLVALLMSDLWERRAHRYAAMGLGMFMGIWGVTFATPFLNTAMTDPLQVPFTPRYTNHTEYIAGYLTGDIAIREAAAYLNQVEPAPPIYANWMICKLLGFYTEHDVICLGNFTAVGDFNRLLREGVEPHEEAYVVFAGFPQFFKDYEWLTWESAGEFPRRLINRPVRVWRVKVIEE